MIQLKERHGGRTWHVRPQAIVSVVQSCGPGSTTLVGLSSGQELFVCESPEEILRQIAEQEVDDGR